MEPLARVVRDYHWGSRTTLAGMFGDPSPSPRPQAELWVGAHPDDPSPLRSNGIGLDQHIAADPVAALGEAAVAAFGPRLPFLLKVLAVESPLSLQVHPDRVRAARGRAAAVAGDRAAALVYRDDRPKPEVLVALTGFDTLSGFRDPRDTARLLDDLACPALAPLRDALAGDPLRWALTEATPEVVAEVVRRCAGRGGEFAAEYRQVVRLGAVHPRDPGVVAALLLNLVTLEPGQAIYVAPGVPHAHLRGTGVELMVDSDNVLRAGLTSKHVDVAGVLDLVDRSPRPPAVLDGEVDGPLRTYRTPDPEFRLSAVRPGPATLVADGPQLLLCVEGVVAVRRGGEEITLAGGDAAFLPHAPTPAELTGGGLAFWATTNR